MADDLSTASLRLSAVGAFIGVIRPSFRRVAVKADGRSIILSVTLDREPDDEVIEAIQVASTEVVADFAEAEIREDVSVLEGALPRADIVKDGLIYERWEQPAEGLS